jgi:hypothetical protein
MKKILLPILFGSLCSAAFADEEEIRMPTTTMSEGTITEYSPNETFIVRETSGPVRYRYGKEVTYLTRGGRTLSTEEVRTRIKAGIPVRISYTTEGDDRVITRIELDED